MSSASRLARSASGSACPVRRARLSSTSRELVGHRAGASVEAAAARAAPPATRAPWRRPQAVLAQRVAARDEVDDAVGRVQPAERARPSRGSGRTRPRGRRRRGRRPPCAGGRSRPARRRAAETAAICRPPARPPRARSARTRAGTSSSTSAPDSTILVAACDGRVDGPVGGPRRDVVGPGEEHLDVPPGAVHVERAAVDVDLDAGGRASSSAGACRRPFDGSARRKGRVTAASWSGRGGRARAGSRPRRGAASARRA